MVLLASVSLGVALPAAACANADDNSVTIRVVVSFVAESNKGGTITGTETLWNAVPQFGKPQAARVGTERYVYVQLSSGKVKGDIVATLPGGTVHVHGVAVSGPGAKLPVVGGTGRYAGATGVMEGEAIDDRKASIIYRLKLPS